jgi:hypothetical protein
MPNRTGDTQGQVLCACSICGVPYLYPAEMRYCSDRLFRCLSTCDRPNGVPLEESKKEGLTGAKQDNPTPRFPVGPKADWWE